MKKQILITGLLLITLASTNVLAAEVSTSPAGQDTQTQDLMASNAGDNGFAPSTQDTFAQSDDSLDQSNENW